MRNLLVAAAVSLALTTVPALAADPVENDLDDLTVVTAQPRGKEVKMVVQTAAGRKAEPQPAEKPAAPADATLALLKTAEK
jgi:hypothetical protein